MYRRLAKNHSIIETIQASSINDTYSAGVIEQRVTHGSKTIGENRNTRWYSDRQANDKTIFKRAYTRLNVHTWNWQCFVGERTLVTLIFRTLRRSNRWWNYNSRDISSIERTTSKRTGIVVSPGGIALSHRRFRFLCGYHRQSASSHYRGKKRRFTSDWRRAGNSKRRHFDKGTTSRCRRNGTTNLDRISEYLGHLLLHELRFKNRIRT